MSLEETRREEPVVLFFYHRAWAEERGSDFPLLSDFQREVVEKDGVKHKAGFPERAYFVVRQRGRCTG